jgi:RimJ/RimL family protein N-acetyltransferase
MEYRRGTEPDIQPICKLGKKMHVESEFKDLHWNEEKVLKWLDMNVKSPNRFVLCAYDESTLAGVFIGSISEFYFGNDRLASDLLWYVGVDYRGGRVGIRLLKEFEKWAREQNVDRIQVGVSSGMSIERTGALLERMGFNQIGGLYKVGS